jgi:acetyl esterase/lipase
MQYENIELGIDYAKLGIKHNGQKVWMQTYIPDRDENEFHQQRKPMILICPGGGYFMLSAREGEPIALRMNALGYNACVLNYSLSPNEFPCQVLEAAKAVAIIREHASQWNTDPDNIVICGFSAGGHVAATLGTLWNHEFISESLGLAKELFKPNKMLLAYPVISSGEYAHRASIQNLLGSRYEELLSLVSLENQVSTDTVPAFMWHTFEDTAVPVENSLLFAMQMHKNNIPCALHMFHHGQHGLALATEETNHKMGNCVEEECSIWPELFDQWMKYDIRQNRTLF